MLWLFLIRWVLTVFGLWVALRLFGGIEDGGLGSFLLAGLIFSIVNSIVKPIVTIFSLPMILLTLGLFVLVVNGIMVWITVLVVPGLEIGFWPAVGAGIVMSLVNHLVNVMQQSYNSRHECR